LIQGVVSGFDRLLLTGSLRQLNHPHGMEVFLFMKGILFTNYYNYLKGVSRRLKQASVASVLEKKPLPGVFAGQRYGQGSKGASDRR
jgi:hypothetical protein